MSDPLDPRLVEPPSPLAQTIGFTMTGWAEGYARIEAPIAAHLMNRQGLPHGGVYATMLDTAMGFCGCHTGDPEIRRAALTVSLTINFLAPATGDRLVAEARVTGGGRSTFFASGCLRDSSGAQVANATGVFRYRQAPPRPGPER